MTLLADFLAPLPEARFKEELRGRQGHLWAAQNPFYERLREAISWDTLLPVLKRCSHLQVWFLDREGQLRRVESTPEDALTLQGAGMTIYASLDPVSWPEFRDIFEQGQQLSELVGVTAGSFRLSFFASLRGSHTPLHFDSGDGFTLQLHGRKRWRLAPNTHLPSPTHNHKANQPLHPGLHPLGGGPLPTTFPPDPLDVTLTPGAMLYVPRGMWHDTHTEEDSISVDFNFSSRTYWKDVVRSAVERMLVSQLEGRQPVLSHPDQIPQVDRLLSHLREQLAGLDARAFFPPTASRPAGVPLRWNPLVTMFVERPEGPRMAVSFASSSPHAEGFEINLPPALLQVVQEIAAGAHHDESSLQGRGIPEAHLRKVLDTLWKEGVLLPAR